MVAQLSLFEDQPASAPAVPGFVLVPDGIDAQTEASLCPLIDAAPLEPFAFGQWRGKRLTHSWGSAYDFSRGAVTPADPMPEWLIRVRDEVVPLFDLDPAAFVQALAIRYDPGAAIGWHRDRPQYGQVVGISLGSPAPLRLRRRTASGGFERVTVPLPPRSAYLLDGPARSEWEHSIMPLERTRHSLTFRTLRAAR